MNKRKTFREKINEIWDDPSRYRYFGSDNVGYQARQVNKKTGTTFFDDIFKNCESYIDKEETYPYNGFSLAEWSLDKKEMPDEKTEVLVVRKDNLSKMNEEAVSMKRYSLVLIPIGINGKRYPMVVAREIKMTNSRGLQDNTFVLEYFIENVLVSTYTTTLKEITSGTYPKIADDFFDCFLEDKKC